MITSGRKSSARKGGLNPGRVGLLLISLLLIAGAILPSAAHALSIKDLFSQGGDFVGKFLYSSRPPAAKTQPANSASPNVQTMLLPKATMNITPTSARGGGDVIIDDESAVVAQEGPSGAGADVVYPKNSTISIYVVRDGDTLSEIAAMFDVSVNTIRWANNMERGSALRAGQTLTILPVTGVKYTVKKGDTLASVAKTYHADADEITSFNGLEGALAVGTEIIIPDGELAIAAPAVSTSPPRGTTSSNAVQFVGYFLRPIAGGVRTQGIHGYNGVDLAAPVGTPILAAAPGEVIVSRQGGWNGGYGNYIVIKHDNGTQTLYAHNTSNIVGIGQRVVQGQVIGYVGTTGRSTGAHVHFEIRGGPRNPF